MKIWIFVLILAFFTISYQNAYEAGPSLHLKLHLDKEEYSLGDIVNIVFDVTGTTEKLTDGRIILSVDECGAGDPNKSNEVLQYEGKPIEFTYKLPEKSECNWYHIWAILDNGSTIDKRDAIIFTKTPTSKILRIIDAKIDKTTLFPRETMNLQFKVTDDNSNTIIPQSTLVMFCVDEVAIDCYAPFAGWTDEDGITKASGEVPIEYQGDYKLKIWSTPPSNTEYLPAKYITDITVKGTPVPKWSCASEEPGYTLCFDMDVMGPIPQPQERGNAYPIKVKIDPDGELRVKIYDPKLELIYDKTYRADASGIVTGGYNIPDNAMGGFYNVQLTSKGEKGKNYYGFVFHIGGTEPSGAPTTSGETLFIFEDIQQDGKIDGPYGSRYVLNNPINLTLRTVTPQPHETLQNHPVTIALFDPDGNVVEQLEKRSDENGKLVYAFIPSRSGHYRAFITSEYQGMTDVFMYKYPVGLRNNYTIFAEGKQFTVTLEGDWYYTSEVRNVEFNQEEKRISVEIGKTDIFNNLAINIPYELLDGGYIVSANGEQVRPNVEKLEHSAIIYIPVDDSVTRVDIVGTSVVPEFPVNLTVVAAVGLIAVLFALMKYRRSI